MPLERTLTHLAALYAADPDPWGHRTRPYERAKHEETLAAVGPGPIGSAIEIGCGNGALTERLAPRCRALLAVEAVPAAFEEARRRLAGDARVAVIRAVAPDGLPPLAPDLVVLSEVLYFLQPAEIDALGGWTRAHAAPGARVVSVNWTGPTGEALTGPQAGDRLIAALPGWAARRRERDGYRIDVLTALP